MNTIGLLGKQLGHSFSKDYFSKKFIELSIENEWSYENIEIDTLDSLFTLIRERKLIGFNVTVPYKIAILPLLDELDDSAKVIGAVNTVKVTHTPDGNFTLKGYNTDAFGFHQLIKPFLELHHERALILGTGGASKAVQYIMKQYGIPFLLVSRTPKNNHEISWEAINEYVLKHHLVIINTTPIGMYPNINDFPIIPYQFLTSKHLLIDLVYNPPITQFLTKGKENNTAILGGLTMLHQQAEKAWKIFRNEYQR
jgi:shikimate dehydrogenase